MVDRLVNSEANACRIAAVESCFGSSGQPLALSGRVLVGEGVLTKMCRKKPKPRQFFLFNDILVYGNIVINKKKYNKQHIIPLEEVKLENLADDGALKNGWFIRTPTKSFAVYAATATEKSEWMAHITKCLEDLLKKTGKKQSTEHAAVWVPDADATTCMHCRKSQFSMINRRHHCRKCGAVVCGPCSNKKFLIPSQSDKPLRVCLACYDTLSKSAATTGSDLSPVSQDKPELPDSSGEDDSEEEGDDAIKEKGTNSDGKTADLEVLSTDDKPTFYRNHSEIETHSNSNKNEEKNKNVSDNDNNSDETRNDSNANNLEVSESHSTELSSVIKSDSTSVELSSSSSVTQSVSHETTSCVSSSCEVSNDSASGGGCDAGGSCD